MLNKERILLLFSGGIDSTVLLYWLLNKNYEVFTLHVNYGQTPFCGESKAINNILNQELSEKLILLEIPNIRNIGSGTLIGEYPEDLCSRSEWYNSEFFPNRNMILLSIAAAYCYKLGCSKIAIGAVGNSYKDTSKDFLESIETSLEKSLGKLKIIAPFASVNRLEVINIASQLNVPLEKTFSCNALGDRHCMLCTSCYERIEALELMVSNGTGCK